MHLPEIPKQEFNTEPSLRVSIPLKNHLQWVRFPLLLFVSYTRLPRLSSFSICIFFPFPLQLWSRWMTKNINLSSALCVWHTPLSSVRPPLSRSCTVHGSNHTFPILHATMKAEWKREKTPGWEGIVGVELGLEKESVDGVVLAVNLNYCEDSWLIDVFNQRQTEPIFRIFSPTYLFSYLSATLFRKYKLLQISNVHIYHVCILICSQMHFL